MAVRGKVEQIAVKINDNTGNATATLSITNANGGVLFSQIGIPENETTIYRAQSMGATDSDFEAFLADEICTFTITPSGNPGASGMTVDVALYINDSESGP